MDGLVFSSATFAALCALTCEILYTQNLYVAKTFLFQPCHRRAAYDQCDLTQINPAGQVTVSARTGYESLLVSFKAGVRCSFNNE